MILERTLRFLNNVLISCILQSPPFLRSRILERFGKQCVQEANSLVIVYSLGVVLWKELRTRDRLNLLRQQMWILRARCNGHGGTDSRIRRRLIELAGINCFFSKFVDTSP